MRKLMNWRSIWLFLSLALAFAVAAPRVQAGTTLVPGGTVTPPDSLTVGGTLVANTGALNYTGILGNLSGLAQTEVFSDPTNVFCAGCLDFVFAVSSSASALTDIARISDAVFTGFSTDAGIASNISCGAGTNIAPANADRSASGQVVGFNFAPSNQVLPGECSSVLVIETNARAWVGGTLQVIDSDVATVKSFAPAVPEPGTMLLLGTGLLSLGVLRRRLFS